MATRILIVEDSATQAMALRQVLEEQGYGVTRMPHGEAALDYLHRESVDLVLSDVNMPGMSGYELCRRIKTDARLAALPVVLLTSLADPLDIVHGLECGADNYVTKPYDPALLCARIRQVVDRGLRRGIPKPSGGVSVNFLGTAFSITSEKEQILDLFMSTVEDVVRTNRALLDSQRDLAAAQSKLEEYASAMAHKARLSTERYAALMHEASDCILVVDTKGRILECNQRATEMFGLLSEDLLGRTLAELAVEDSAGLFTRALDDLAVHQHVSAELTVVHRSGRLIRCGCSASRTSNADGDLVLAILHDLTAMKEAIDRLEKSEAQLKQAHQIAALGTWERNLNNHTTEWSEETCRIMGVPEDQRHQRMNSFLSQVDPADAAAVVAALRATSETGKLDVKFRVRRPDGVVRTVHGRGESTRNERGELVLVRGTVQDITEQRQLEEQLHQAQKMEAIGQLAGGVAHDFNNLLTVISGYSQFLLADSSLKESQAADIAEIELAAKRAAALTRQLLAFSRRQIVQARLVDVNVLTKDLDKLLRRLLREDIVMDLELDAESGTVWADPGQLEQVLMNLVVNARDAMPAGGTLTIRTSNAVLPLGKMRSAEIGAAGGPSVMIEVSDTGTGIPPAIQARMFEPFFTTKEVGAGTGLGLSTVLGIVQQCGGEISVESTVDVGTTFQIALPLRDEAANGEATVERRAAGVPGGTETVLIVEDDASVRKIACRALQQHGYTVLEASRARQALEICANPSTPVDLVITDVVMPEMSGFELAQKVDAIHPWIRMLFISGYASDSSGRFADAFLVSGNATQSLGKDVTHYLEKPFTSDALAQKVREVLDGKSPRGGPKDDGG